MMDLDDGDPAALCVRIVKTWANDKCLFPQKHSDALVIMS